MPSFVHFCIAVTLASAISLLVGKSNIDSTQTHGVHDLNITVVLLNWSRLSNVVKITSEICENLLEDTVQSIVVWNNNPNKISHQDFPSSPCPRDRLRIINSPENLYFQARYMACAGATTAYCFVQDDDFSIRPEIIKALNVRINQGSVPAIHLQPPNEMLSSQLRTIVVGNTIHTTFAWLGYGTVLMRSRAVEFLLLLDRLKLSEDERKMADNYFTILSNIIPERWFDEGIELGGGQAFTVGTEGDERNNRHIVRAAAILDTLVSANQSNTLDLPFTSFSTGIPEPLHVSRASCHDKPCIFETSINLLPHEIGGSPTSAAEILRLEKDALLMLGEARKSHYLEFPPSHAVDGRADTAFRSPQGANRDDYVALDTTKSFSYVKDAELVFLVDPPTEIILRHSAFEFSADGHIWNTWDRGLECFDANFAKTVRLCKSSLSHVSGRHFRVRTLKPMQEKWGVFEMFVDIQSEA
ncbi:hypothetical protein NLJ89_g234 [Agrocybe chaxingu]|uniref:Glycosyltransferase 2-like domain-containing protein n=1 Tax=Agrocybe chaxingu TaxID=84603 RepID=A0A9W8TGQ1_9AGAR|nr:hypothetical protein NLJ89_g234 [Agrocybe chaxingu]